MEPGRARRAGWRLLAGGLALAAAIALATTPAEAGRGGGSIAKSSVIGGKPAVPAAWPFTVAILRRGRLHCGGTVIAPTKVLTAAHCVEGFPAGTLEVAASRPVLSSKSVGETIGVAAAVPHPDFVFNQAHDVGVLTLERATSAPAVALATAEQDRALTATGQLLRVAGWGAQNPLGINISPVLKRTSERVRSNDRCKRAYRRIFKPRSMICALGKRLSRYGRAHIHSAACSGDSGGPLVGDTPAGPVEVGTVSFGGPFCGISRAPTVYSRVSDSLAFIQDQIAAP